MHLVQILTLVSKRLLTLGINRTTVRFNQAVDWLVQILILLGCTMVQDNSRNEKSRQKTPGCIIIKKWCRIAEIL